MVCPGRGHPAGRGPGRRARARPARPARRAVGRVHRPRHRAATGRPAVVVVTSGTAAAELHAAVVEADLGCVPLLVCTADRPPELRDVGAPQTIDQTHLYGRATRWSTDPGVPDEASRPRGVRSGPGRWPTHGPGPRGPGPVHLNLPFREPLLGDAGRGGVPDGRPDGAPWHRVEAARPSPGRPGGRARGRRAPSGPPGADRGREPVWRSGAPCSHCRRRSAGRCWPIPGRACGRPAPPWCRPPTPSCRAPRFATDHRPDLVLRLGERWVSKVVTAFLAGSPSVAVDPTGGATPNAVPTASCGPTRPGSAGRWPSPRGRSGPPRGRRRVGRRRGTGPSPRHSGPSTRCSAADGTCTEPSLARALPRSLAGGHLVVSSSMPVRDVESFGVPRGGPGRVVANRGANGIDGVVSTALGVALATGPTVALVGDLAFLHDASALVGPPRRSSGTDRGGGRQRRRGDLLVPAPGHPPDPRPLRAAVRHTPGGRSGRGGPRFRLGRGRGRGSGWATSLDRAVAPRAGGRVVVVRLPDRGTNVSVHDQVNAAVVDALDRA